MNTKTKIWINNVVIFVLFALLIIGWHARVVSDRIFIVGYTALFIIYLSFHYFLPTVREEKSRKVESEPSGLEFGEKKG